MPDERSRRYGVTEVKDIQGNPIIILGDKIARKNHLISFIQNLRTENALLKNEQQIKYAVCEQTIDVALSLKRHQEDVKMILLGPGLTGKADTIARMLSGKTHIILIIDHPRFSQCKFEDSLRNEVFFYLNTTATNHP